MVRVHEGALHISAANLGRYDRRVPSRPCRRALLPSLDCSKSLLSSPTIWTSCGQVQRDEKQGTSKRSMSPPPPPCVLFHRHCVGAEHTVLHFDVRAESFPTAAFWRPSPEYSDSRAGKMLGYGCGSAGGKVRGRARSLRRTGALMRSRFRSTLPAFVQLPQRCVIFRITSRGS
jgi:hypothetical protein